MKGSDYTQEEDKKMKGFDHVDEPHTEQAQLAQETQILVLVTKPHNKTPYELLHGRLPSIGFMRPFGCPVTILNTLDPLGKFQGKVDEGFLIGYSVCSKAFRVFNSRTRIVQETLHVNFMENKPNVAGEEGTQTYVLFPVLFDDSTNSHNNNKDALVDGKEHDDDIQKSVSPDIHSSSSGAQTRKQGHKTENKDKGKSPVVTIIGFRDLNAKLEECNNNSSNGVNTASSSVSTAGHNFINRTNNFSATGPSNAAMSNLEDLTHYNDADDVGAEADINNLESIISVNPIPTTRIHKDHLTSQIIGDLSSTTQTRIDLTYGKRAIGTKWVYRNKKDERGIVIRNKARLVAQVHTQEEGIDYEEVFAQVARIKAIRLFLAYASFMGFMVYQMDVKSAFLYRTIKEEVYVCQPPGFEDPGHPNKVYKVVKALYDLHQAPRAWIEAIRLFLAYDSFMVFMVYQMDVKNTFLYETTEEEVYVCQPPGFEDPGYPDKVYKVVKALYGLHQAPKAWKFALTDGKSANITIDTEKPLLKDPDGEDVDVHTYRSMICSLMYLTSSRPDIMFTVCACARFQVTHKASHLHAVKRIFRLIGMHVNFSGDTAVFGDQKTFPMVVKWWWQPAV
nr:hypothetical protein [Tanacetum cinerariifolium]